MADDPGDVFTWRAHPAREHRPRAMLGLAIIAVLAALAGNLMGQAWWAVLWAVLWAALMVGILNRFFFASRFSIDEEGITARYPLKHRRARWANLRRFVHDEHGGYLSRRASRSRLDAFGGMHILFGEQRETVIARIRAELKRGDSAWAR